MLTNGSSTVENVADGLRCTADIRENCSSNGNRKSWNKADSRWENAGLSVNKRPGTMSRTFCHDAERTLSADEKLC